jgi:hypothetical protein
MHPHLRRSCLGIFLALLLLPTVPACGVRQLAKGEIQPPKVTFQDLKIYQPTARGWPLGARLLLENPNPQAVNLLGQTVAEVPITVQLPAVMELLPQFLPMLQKSQQQRQFHYQIAGSFRLASVMGGIIPIPFKFQGEASPQEGMNFLRPYLK